MNLDEEYSYLQLRFAHIDLFTKPQSKSRSGMLEVLLIKKQNMKIKIYQEKGHYLPHIHIDYGNNKHVASYAIETGKRLEGNLSKKYDTAVFDWLQDNRENVLKGWNDLQAGNPIDHIVKELQADE
ncbi:DUF4160 domain-containing protein [Aliarcobacter skirrowii]|uniref:DUF4160 domain-containing protein n=1 Tax=Aliarcobacter skirrowii TaxID=28200 RepID=UPI0029B45FC8|nr:DUF4160 domain-containing protein [Aliarcobacter skirrowii]MDX4058801.1 DUF4160 domain-containing protein [Aliarcobacter skirrowii]